MYVTGWCLISWWMGKQFKRANISFPFLLRNFRIFSLSHNCWDQFFPEIDQPLFDANFTPPFSKFQSFWQWHSNLLLGHSFSLSFFLGLRHFFFIFKKKKTCLDYIFLEKLFIFEVLGDFDERLKQKAWRLSFVVSSGFLTITFRWNGRSC